MHPRIYAQRMAVAAQRLSASLEVLTEKAGAKMPEQEHSRDVQTNLLFQIEWAANAADRAVVGSTGEHASLRDRLMEVKYVTEANVDEVMSEVERESEAPLVERLDAIDGIGKQTAKIIAEEFGSAEAKESEPDNEPTTSDGEDDGSTG